MRITSLLSNLIVEQSRFQVLYDKLVKPAAKAKGEPTSKKPKGLMDFQVLKDIIFTDPTTKVPEGVTAETASIEDMEKVKVGKYSQWMLKNYLKADC
jgi:hypothetical protein